MTSHVAVKPPSFVETVITALPGDTEVTFPLSTVTAFSFEVNHLTDLSAASAGVAVAVRVSVSPGYISNEDLLRETPVTCIADLSETVTLQLAERPPFSVVTVMMAFPGLMPVMTPSDTVATDLSEEFHETLSYAFAGDTQAVRFFDVPVETSRAVLSSETLDGLTFLTYVPVSM